MMMRQGLETVLIAATDHYTQLSPWGSHPLLDPLWSTEATTIIHDGSEATRAEKIMNWICRSDLALQNLRVCLSPNDQYNCGRCEKCLRTMIPLYVAGCLGRSAFPRELPIKEAAHHRYRTDGAHLFALDNINLLESKPDQSPDDRHLIRAMERAIRRSQQKLARRARRHQPPRNWPLMDRLRGLVGR
jgi:hypothetical protein